MQHITLDNVNFAYVFQWVKLRGSTLCKGLGAVLPLPVKWLWLTGTIGAGLQRTNITCGACHHIKPDQMKYTDILYQIYHIFQSSTWQSVPNILYQINHIFQSYTRLYCTKYTIYLKAILDYTVQNIPYVSKIYSILLQYKQNFLCIWGTMSISLKYMSYLV